MPRYLPKSIVCFREGYNGQKFVRDLVAGITVGIIALPLAMAFGIASIRGDVAASARISPPAAGLSRRSWPASDFRGSAAAGCRSVDQPGRSSSSSAESRSTTDTPAWRLPRSWPASDRDGPMPVQGDIEFIPIR